jgi:hypothetical protein
MASTRWYVTLATGDVEDVGADNLDIREGGTLIFQVGTEFIGYAPHAWVSFFSEDVH